MVWIFLLFLFQSVLSHPKQILAQLGANAVGNNGMFCSGNGTQGINTALGCVPVEIGPFVGWLSGYVFGISGGIAFLMMVYGFFLMSTSSGDPKAVQGAKETVTSAITGLLVSIFGMFILRLIALDILQIPGLV